MLGIVGKCRSPLFLPTAPYEEHVIASFGDPEYRAKIQVRKETLMCETTLQHSL